MHPEERTSDDKKIYKCEICGSEYENLEDRIKCETKCLEKVKKEDEESKKKLAEKEKDELEQKIRAAYEHLNALINEYVREYGSIKIGFPGNLRGRVYDSFEPFFRMFF